MRRFAAIVAALLALIYACSFPQPYGYAQFQDVPAATCHSTFVRTFNAQEFTDPVEQVQLTQAADAWRMFSGGQIDLRITFTEPGSALIHRVHAVEPIVSAEERQTNARPGSLLGWESGGDVNLIVDRVALDQLRSLAEHELGHAADLRWPLCTLPGQDCVHSPDPAAVMAPSFSGAITFTPSDLALCRASCLCP